jgi:pimeloyl-ACP methyl ester carboxylesterase
VGERRAVASSTLFGNPVARIESQASLCGNVYLRPPRGRARGEAVECRLRSITVHYDAVGEGRPIIMLHGKSADHRHMVAEFEPIFRRRAGWRRICPDPPGHGGTRGPEWITSNEEILQVILDFIDAVIPGRRFALAGMSYGGYLARGVAYRRSASMDGMLLVVPGGHARWRASTCPGHPRAGRKAPFRAGFGL